MTSGGAKGGTKLSRTDVLRVAVEADCDPRTVQRVLDGKLVRVRVRERITKALDKLGISYMIFVPGRP